MIRRRPTFGSSYLSTPPPETPPISDCEADDEDVMSIDDRRPTRPMSIINPKANPRYPQRPTLPDVLSNSAPQPWTLSAFTAYLSQNHCLENLEFTMAAERYREAYESAAAQKGGKPVSSAEDSDFCKKLWQRLIDAYIVPEGPREINIPSGVRDRLLALPFHSAPPRPEVLQPALKIIYDLMEGSVLPSFLNDTPASRQRQIAVRQDSGDSDDQTQQLSQSKPRKMTRSRSRNGAKHRPGSPSLDVRWSLSSSPPDRSSNTSSRSSGHRQRRAGSGDSTLTDDSIYSSSTGKEPMTPPTTPPSSDVGGGSPKNRGENNWKKMLGWKKRSHHGMRDDRYPTMEE